MFDLNRCTGCGACMVACTIEKEEPQGLNRRNVVTFNENLHPALPVFSLSMACNHCGVPACEINCPASAISKDAATGAVILDPKKCMGCKYCTWACPYDAPRFNEILGTVAKCDFCITRLQTDDLPACICACPTHALRLVETNPAEIVEPRLAGFTNAGLQPAIQFKYLRQQNSGPVLSAQPSTQAINRLFESCLDVPPVKITLKMEWTLLVFTFMASILTAWFTAFLTVSLPLNPLIFLSMGGIAMALSTIHLGKKLRAYRAIFNFKRSWLSREIFLFSAFLGLSGLYLLFFPSLSFLGWIALVTGFFSLFAIDRIYQVALHIGPANFHSAHVLFNGLYLAGFLTGNTALFVGAGVLKLVLYLYRKYLFKKVSHPIRPLVSLVRIFLGFWVPALVFLLKPDLPANTISGLAVGCILIGELIDRTEYYHELDIITPSKQILVDLKKELFNTTKNN